MNLPADAVPGLSENEGGKEQEDVARRAAQEEQMRKDVMSRILEPAARERLSRISLVSQQRAQQIETVLMRMATGGQLRGKVTEAHLIDLLDQFEDARGESAKSRKPKILYQRRKDFDDDFDI